MMPKGYAIVLSIGICLAAASLEGLCAGRQVKAFFGSVRFPRYSAPLWLWSLIGGLYYLIFWFVIFRLLRLDSGAKFRSAALALIFVMLTINALTNLVIFRARDLRFSFFVGAIFPVMDIALLFFLIRLDRLSAWSLIPYLVYRAYAVWWGYSLWKLNDTAV